MLCVHIFLSIEGKRSHPENPIFSTNRARKILFKNKNIMNTTTKHAKNNIFFFSFLIRIRMSYYCGCLPSKTLDSDANFFFRENKTNAFCNTFKNNTKNTF